jgi:hypothetical protein
MAVFVTVFSWILIFLLESRLACRIRIRLADDDADLEQAFSTVQSMLVSRGCRLQNSALYKGKQQLSAHSGGTRYAKTGALRAMLPHSNNARIAMDIV